jgi:hypothetical protein
MHIFDKIKKIFNHPREEYLVTYFDSKTSSYCSKKVLIDESLPDTQFVCNDTHIVVSSHVRSIIDGNPITYDYGLLVILTEGISRHIRWSINLPCLDRLSFKSRIVDYQLHGALRELAKDYPSEFPLMLELLHDIRGTEYDSI